jgi:P27 family predicted phage terminase small subunit
MAGRRPKPTALHRLQGTWNATNHGRDRVGEAIALGELGKAPSGLTPLERRVWRYAIEHAPPGVLKAIDRDLLMVWCEARARWEVARREQLRLDREAPMKLCIMGSNGNPRPSPYHAILERCAGTMFRAAQELGFSPAARPRIRIAPEPRADEASPWAALRLVSE